MKKSIGCFIFLNGCILLLGIAIGFSSYDKLQQLSSLILPIESNENNNGYTNNDSHEDGIIGSNQTTIFKATEGDDAKSVTQGNTIITQNTEFIIREYQEDSTIYEDSTIRVPSMYVGMTREEYLEALKEYEKAPGLSQTSKGFMGAELVAFSGDRVITKYIYHVKSEESEYYVIVLDDKVVIMDEKMEKVYLNTGIYLKSLPYELQLEIMNCKYLHSEKDLYNFLESCTS